MARLPFDIWAIRKKKTAAEIVSQGVSNREALDEFLKERGVAMPQDLTDFEKIWEAEVKEVPKKAPASVKAPAKKAAPSNAVKKTPARSTRRKSNIKDSSSKD